jgi:hypothetical protein
MRFPRLRAALVATVVAVPAVVVLWQAPAHAITCDSVGIEPFADVRTISPTLTNEAGSRTVTLTLYNARISDWSHARLNGQTRPGDKAWVERASSSSGPWTACPKTEIAYGNQVILTREAFNRGYWMRACLQYPVLSYWPIICTTPYFDQD